MNFILVPFIYTASLSFALHYIFSGKKEKKKKEKKPSCRLTGFLSLSETRGRCVCTTYRARFDRLSLSSQLQISPPFVIHGCPACSPNNHLSLIEQLFTNAPQTGILDLCLVAEKMYPSPGNQ